MIISANIFISIGIILILIFIYLTNKRGSFFPQNSTYYILASLVLIIFVVILFFTKSTIFFIENRSEYKKYYGWGSSYTYTFKNGARTTIDLAKKIVINNTSQDLFYEEKNYGNYPILYSNEKDKKITILPFSSNAIDGNIEYVLEDPPSSIRVKKNSGTKSRGWIHF